MKKLILPLLVIFITSCGYHLRSSNKLASSYPDLHLQIGSQSLLKRCLSNALSSSNVKLSASKENVARLNVTKDSLRKVIQSVGTSNQVQEYRLEYDVEYTLDDMPAKTIHLEKDYSFDIQQIGGGQQEELTLRKQLAQDMAWAIIRQINSSISE